MPFHAPPHIAGLSIASALKDVGAKLVLLEARATIGGVWRSFGNPHSRVNSTEPVYRMRVQRVEPNTDHSYFFEIIDDIRRLVTQKRLASHLCLGALVRAIVKCSHNSSALQVSGTRALPSLQSPERFVLTAARL